MARLTKSYTSQEIDNATFDSTNRVSKVRVIDSAGTNVDSFGSPSTVSMYRSPNDFTATYTSNVTITLAGLPFTPTNAQIVYIRVVPSSGTAKVYVNGSGGVTMTISSSVITIAGAGTPFASGDAYEVGINGQDKGYDSTTSTGAVSESSPLSTHHVEETLISVTNQTTNTTAYGYIDMDGYTGLTVQGETSDAVPTDVLTVTLEGTCQDDGTAAASCTYQDITKLFYDKATNALGTANWADTDFVASLSPAVAGLWKYVRVKYVTSNGGGNDADLIVYIKKAFV